MAPKAEAPKDSGADAGSNSTVMGASLYLGWGLGFLGTWFTFLSPFAIRCQSSVLTPDGRADHEPLDNLMFSFACIAAVGILDCSIARLFGPGRYFALHTMVNAIMIYFVSNDLILMLSAKNPYDTVSCTREGTPCVNKLPLDLTVGIHLWHSLAYALKPIDWVHHIPSYVVCALGICLPFGPVLNASVFALMGLPGGIDYMMLTLIKIKMLHPRVEKDWNQTMNVWLRYPLAMMTAAAMCGGPLLHPEHFASKTHRIMFFLVGVHHFWNGGFFMYRTVDARTRFTIKEKEKAAAAKAAKAS